MIEHNYVLASDDIAQWEADRINRQEVTADWYFENGVDSYMPLWAWVVGDETMGIDPWRLIELDQVKPHYRLFVQREDL